MNITVLSRIDIGHAVLQPGETATLPDAAALACIRSGAAEPADRRARQLAAEDAATIAKAAAELVTSPEALAAHARHESLQVKNRVTTFLRGRNV